MRDLVVLGGPNGAGKTTAAQMLVPHKLGISEFVNADEIARGLSPFNPDAAAFESGRLMLQRMRSLAGGERSFAIETACSGVGHIRFLRHCKDAGWRIILVFLWLPSPEAAVARVAQRVPAGGHAVDPAIVVRRYRSGLRNVRARYLPLADEAMIYDNAGDTPKLMAHRVPGTELAINDSARWALIEKAIE